MSTTETNNVQTYRKILSSLYDLSNEQLFALNKEIVARINSRSSEASQSFAYGDRVTWTDKMNNQIFGVVRKVNRKTITVDSEKGTRWKITASLLKHV